MPTAKTMKLVFSIRRIKTMLALHPPAAKRRAMALVWVAVMGFALIGFIGLAMDVAVTYLAGTNLQVAADAGALAATRFVRDTDLSLARNAAVNIAHENKAAGIPVSVDPGSDVVIGHYFRFAQTGKCGTPPCFLTNLAIDTPNAVRVYARRTSASPDKQVPLVFGAAPVFGVTGVDVTRKATAIISGGTGSGLITLDPHGDCALSINGNDNLTLNSGNGYTGDNAIQVNSDSDCAMCTSGASFNLTAPETNIVGVPGYCPTGNPTLSTYINPDSPAMPDPLAGLGAPTIGADLGSIPNGGKTIYDPGYYSGGLNITGNKTFTLNQGIYVLSDTGNNRGGLQTGGSSSLIAHNVMLYILKGPLDLSGSGTTEITPMTDSIPTGAPSEFVGISIYQARSNTTTSRITGTAGMNLQGTLYFPNAELDVQGTGIALGNQLISYRLSLGGTDNFTIQYDGRNPSPGTRIFLVE
ncbi:MAG: hypothetical protein HY287_13035 [Planctomycetes bacterium]|nr:hypothetical protein [Planctomycetota bacterium]